MNKVFCVISFISLFLSCESSKVRQIINDQKAIDSLLDEHVNNGSYPFLYARIENIDGTILYEHSVVNHRLLPDIEVNGDTWIRIWSMSKIVTISILMDLVEDGMVDLNDPVIKYIPEFSNLKVAESSDGKSLSMFTQADTFSKASDKQLDLACPIQLVEPDSIMRVHHLINHRAGFYYANTTISCLDSISVEADLSMVANSDSLINRLSNMPLIHHPGERYHYGLNTTVLGLVAERASSKTLDELVNDRIATPCGIEGFQYRISEDIQLIPTFTGRDGTLRRAVSGELDIMGANVPMYDKDQRVYFGGEGMVATSDGYADFLRLWLGYGKLNNHRFLDKTTLKSMISSIDRKDGYGTSTKYGVYITGDSTLSQGKGDKGLWQGGGYEGTSFWIDPKRKFVGLLMTQVNQSPDHVGLGSGLYDKFRGLIYKQIFDREI